MRVPGVGGPRQAVSAALSALNADGLRIEAVSPIIASAPLGPSRRYYANATALVAGDIDPPRLLAVLKRHERMFGRRKRGGRWGARPLDLDIVLWSGGIWLDDALAIPHPRFRTRGFVLRPAAAIAPDWRDPGTQLRLRHLAARLTRPRPLPR